MTSVYERNKEATHEARIRLSEQKKLAQSKLGGRLNAQETNPCLKEHNLSMKCISDNNNNTDDACKLYFENYKACKQFWLSVQQKRRFLGLKPDLPPLKEREKIKEDYLKSR